MAVAEQRARVAIPLWPWGYVATNLVAIGAVLVAPLATYVFTIALFGLPHVLCELRYCDERFSARAPRASLMLIGISVVGLVVLRIGQSAGFIPGSFAVPAELFVGVGLVAVAVRFMPHRRMLGAIFGSAIAVGATFAPIPTFLIFAWLHNLTPLGFLAEILPARERRSTLLLLLIPFIAVPSLIASGVLQTAMQEWFGYSLTGAPSLFGAGRYPLSAYLSGGLPFSNALPLFSAAVAAQIMHYFSVIVVMPRLLQRRGSSPNGSGLVRWPSWRTFYLALGAFALLVFAFNAIDYKSARAAYGVAAAIHSWIELPIFLIALGAGFGALRKSGSRSAKR